MLSKSERSPLACLILFIIFLAAAGSILAGGTYLINEQINQDLSSHPPMNGDNCYEVSWWTSLWYQIFHIKSCGVCYHSYNCCCD
jgi:hypothetical protein